MCRAFFWYTTMKITTISIDNVLGLSYARINITKPVAFFGGGNGAGKTSLVESVRMAFTGAGQRGIKLKKDFSELVRGGQKKGAVAVETSDGSCTLALPKGEHSSFAVLESPFLPYLLDASLFARADDKQRRSDLMKLCGVKITGKLLADRLRKRGVAESLLEKIGALIAGGFQVAHSAAKAEVSTQRGVWEGITGEKYGSDKAVGWAAPSQPCDPALVANVRQQLADARAELNAKSGELVAMRNEAKARNQLIAKRQQLQELAGQIEARQQQQAACAADAASAQQQLEEARALAGDVNAIGYQCPCCSEVLVLVGGQLQKAGQRDPEAAARLPALERALQAASNALANSNALLAEAQGAAAALASLGDVPADRALAITVLENEVQEAVETVAALEESAGNVEQIARQAEQAADVTQRAAAAHQLVQDWTKAAEALASDGIPSDLTREAITPFNALLAKLAGMAGWPVVQLSDDLQVVRGDRPYRLLSESEQWRADTLLALAVANLSGLRFALIDRFDCLQPSARGEALDLFSDAAEAGLFDTVLVAGTLKAPLAEEELINSFWIAEAEVTAQGAAPEQKAA